MSYQQQFFEISRQIRANIRSLVQRISDEKAIDKDQVFAILGSINPFDYNHLLLSDYRGEIAALLEMTRLQVELENKSIQENLK